MSNSRVAALSSRLASVFLLGLFIAGFALAAESPLDANGLPLWEEQFTPDFPVRLLLPDVMALDALLARASIASFHREQIRVVHDTPFESHLEFTPRVTESELRAMEALGFLPQRLPDLERENWESILATWRDQYERGGDAFTRGERGVYHTYAQMTQILEDAAVDHPSICRMGSIGQSVQGRELYTLIISDNVYGAEEAEPEVRISASIHGNEKIAIEMSLYLVDYLTDHYGQFGYEDVTYLVDNYEIHMLPLHNPDGHVVNSRYNANGRDLNRNYPVPDGSAGGDGTYLEEPETWQYIDWSLAQNFVIGQDGHGGALVVNYPWDYTYDLTPDDEAFILLSEEFSFYNPPMWNGDWYHGITNGAQWYRTYGSVQDWSYEETDCMHVIVEFSDSYAPPAGLLDQYWDDNRESFMHWIKAARYGVNGIVSDAQTGAPLTATVAVVGNSKPVHTDPEMGDYYKLLESGTWDLSFSAAGYETLLVEDVSTVWGLPTVLDVELAPEGTGLDPAVPDATVLLGAFPNPFNPRTTLHFELAEAGPVVLALHDLRGRRIRILQDGDLEAGSHHFVWNGRDDADRAVAGGIYFARLEAGTLSFSAKLVLLK